MALYLQLLMVVLLQLFSCSILMAEKLDQSKFLRTFIKLKLANLLWSHVLIDYIIAQCFLLLLSIVETFIFSHSHLRNVSSVLSYLISEVRNSSITLYCITHRDCVVVKRSLFGNLQSVVLCNWNLINYRLKNNNFAISC